MSTKEITLFTPEEPDDLYRPQYPQYPQKIPLKERVATLMILSLTATSFVGFLLIIF